jgi:hypothetical protein
MWDATLLYAPARRNRPIRAIARIPQEHAGATGDMASDGALSARASSFSALRLRLA